MKTSPLIFKIANEIIALINVRHFVEGERLASDALAKHFAVSRSPVRQALELLARERRIISIENRGFSVKNSHETLHFLEMPEDSYVTFASDWLNDAIPCDVSEQLLREKYGVTKTQANDLLLRAAREGWAEPKAGYGWLLRPVAKTKEAYAQIYRFRAVIEPAALLELSFSYDAKIAETLKQEQEMLLTSDIVALPQDFISNIGIRFHEELIKMSGNALYLTALERANQLRKLLEYRFTPNKQRVMQQSRDHLHILELLKRNEMLEAAHFMKQHLNGALEGKVNFVKS